MRLWRDTKCLWLQAWDRSPLRVVIGLSCMVALLAAALVVLSDDSDAAGTAAPVSPPANLLIDSGAPKSTNELWFRDESGTSSTPT